MSRLSFRAVICSRAKETKPPLLPFVLPFCLPERIVSESVLESFEVGDRERLGLAEGVHIGPHVVDPDALCVGLVGLASGEETGHWSSHPARRRFRSADAGSCERRRAPSSNSATSAHVVFEENVVGHHDGGPAARLERSNNVLNESELLIRGVCRDREIGPCRPPSALLRSEGWVRENEVSLADSLAVRRECVSALHHALDAMEHEVHQAEPVRVRHKLDSDERVACVGRMLSASFSL